MEFKKMSEILKKYMKDKKLSQYALAEKSGVSRSYISDIVGEKRSDSGSKEAIEKILLALELSEEEKREVWINWLAERGHIELMKYLRNLEKTNKIED